MFLEAALLVFPTSCYIIRRISCSTLSLTACLSACSRMWQLPRQSFELRSGRRWRKDDCRVLFQQMCSTCLFWIIWIVCQVDRERGRERGREFEKQERISHNLFTKLWVISLFSFLIFHFCESANNKITSKKKKKRK